MALRYSGSVSRNAAFLSSHKPTSANHPNTHNTFSFHLRAESFTDANRSSDQALSSHISIVRVTSPPTTNSSGSTMSNTSFSEPKSTLTPLLLMTFVGGAHDRCTCKYKEVLQVRAHRYQINIFSETSDSEWTSKERVDKPPKRGYMVQYGITCIIFLTFDFLVGALLCLPRVILR